MTPTPDEATLIAIKHNMNMLLELLPVNGKTEFDMGDASVMASVPAFAVLASARAVPHALDYTLPRVPVTISDADIARIADAVRPAPGFTGGEVFGKIPTTGPFPANYGGPGQYASSTEGIPQREPWLKAAVSRQFVPIDADGQPIPADKGGLE